MRFSSLLRSGFAVLLFSTALARAQEYKIKLTRPDKVKTGSASKVQVTVAKLTRDGNELYPAGTVITAEKGVGPKTDFSIGDAPVDMDKAEPLDAVIQVQSDKRTSNDDEMTGTDQAQKVGGTWPINADKLAREMIDDGAPVTAADLKGESKLADIRTQNDIQVMEIQLRVSDDNMKKDNADGSSITDGKLKVDVNFVLPTDDAKPPLTGTVKMHLNLNIALPGGAGTANLVSDREMKEERSAKK